MKAHLRDAVDVAQRLEWWQTAVHYQVVHALLLLLLGAGAPRARATGFKWATRLIVLGVLFFSGSLYMLAATGMRAWAHFAPFGGMALIVSWCAAAWAFYVGPDPSAPSD